MAPLACLDQIRDLVSQSVVVTYLTTKRIEISKEKAILLI